SSGRSFSAAAAARALQMLSIVAGALGGFAAGDSSVSTGRSSSGSPALACPTPATGGKSNAMKKNADPAGLRISVRPWIVPRGPYAGRTPKGESAADLPVIYPASLGVAINLVTAKALGLSVPPVLLPRCLYHRTEIGRSTARV